VYVQPPPEIVRSAGKSAVALDRQATDTTSRLLLAGVNELLTQFAVENKNPEV